jgi:hypothetical protein
MVAARNTHGEDGLFTILLLASWTYDNEWLSVFAFTVPSATVHISGGGSKVSLSSQGEEEVVLWQAWKRLGLLLWVYSTGAWAWNGMARLGVHEGTGFGLVYIHILKEGCTLYIWGTLSDESSIW